MKGWMMIWLDDWLVDGLADWMNEFCLNSCDLMLGEIVSICFE